MVGDMDRMRFSFKERWFFRNSWYAWRPVVVDFDARRIEFVRCGFFESLYLHFCASMYMEVSYVNDQWLKHIGLSANPNRPC